MLSWKTSIARTSMMIAAGAAVALGLAKLAVNEARAQAPTYEIAVTIVRIKALDKFDAFSKGDMYGRVTIGSKKDATPVLKGIGQGEATPNWTITKAVAPGVHKVKVELLDKDISVDDPIDINRLDRKRDLDFTIDTRSCRIDGFAQTFRCGAKISRAGKEEKKAEITFTVSVKKK